MICLFCIIIIWQTRRRHSPTMIHRLSAMVCFIKPPPPPPQSHTATVVANTRGWYLFSSLSLSLSPVLSSLYLSLARISNAVRSVRRVAVHGIRIYLSIYLTIYIYIYTYGRRRTYTWQETCPVGNIGGGGNEGAKMNRRRVKNCCTVEGTRGHADGCRRRKT